MLRLACISKYINQVYYWEIEKNNMANLQQIATSLMQTLENNTAIVKQAEFYLESASKE